jgi:hypothetical protein
MDKMSGNYAFGWVQGFEVNLLSTVAGVDLRRPAINLPDLPRSVTMIGPVILVGLPSASWT